MEEKKTIKISLSTFFLLLALIAIVVMAIFMYKFYDDKKKADQKSSNLENQLSNLNETVKDLNDKISNTSNTNEVSNSNNTTTSSEASFTDAEIKTSLSKFLEMDARSGCDSLLEYLSEQGLLGNIPYASTVSDNGVVTTNVKFSDYKKAMLNYVSEDYFNKGWTSPQNFYENDEGYLVKVQGGGGLVEYTINSISKIDDTTYLANTTAKLVDLDDSTESRMFNFSVSSYNGKCVIDSFEYASN